MIDQGNLGSNEISIKELIGKLKDWCIFLSNHWIKIFIGAFIGAISGYIYADYQPITYTAKTTFVVEESKGSGSSLGGLMSLAGQFGVDIGGGGGGIFSGDNILLYLKSPTLSREVLLTQLDSISTKSIADVYAEIYNLKETWQKNKNIGKVSFPPNQSNVKYSRIQDSLLQIMISKISSTQFVVQKTDKKSGFIDVITNMESEALSKVYSERIVQLAVDKYVGIKTLRQKSNVDKLQKRLDSISSLLRRKTVSGATLQTSSSTMDINPIYKTNNNIDVETTIRDKNTLGAIFASVTQSLEMAKFNLSQETPIIQIVDFPMLPLKVVKTSKLKCSLFFSILGSMLLVVFLIAQSLFYQKLD